MSVHLVYVPLEYIASVTEYVDSLSVVPRLGVAAHPRPTNESASMTIELAIVTDHFRSEVPGSHVAFLVLSVVPFLSARLVAFHHIG